MATNPQDANASQQQVVAILEEDEFEEFEAEGKIQPVQWPRVRSGVCSYTANLGGALPPFADWDERQEDPQQQQLWEQVRTFNFKPRSTLNGVRFSCPNS
jgi:hypothetical protein